MLPASRSKRFHERLLSKVDRLMKMMGRLESSGFSCSRVAPKPFRLAAQYKREGRELSATSSQSRQVKIGGLAMLPRKWRRDETTKSTHNAKNKTQNTKRKIPPGPYTLTGTGTAASARKVEARRVCTTGVPFFLLRVPGVHTVRFCWSARRFMMGHYLLHE